MKIINKNGLNKIVKCLKENKLSNSDFYIVEKDDKTILIHEFNEQELEALKTNKISLIKESVGHILVSEQTDTLEQTTAPTDVTPESELGKTEKTTFTDEQINDLVQQIIPKLNETFPSKEQVTTAINKVQSNMVDSEEWLDNLKVLSRRIKKDSRTKLSESSIHPGLHVPTNQDQVEHNNLGAPNEMGENGDDIELIGQLIDMVKLIANKGQIKIIDPSVTDIRKPPNLANL